MRTCVYITVDIVNERREDGLSMGRWVKKGLGQIRTRTAYTGQIETRNRKLVTTPGRSAGKKERKMI